LLIAFLEILLIKYSKFSVYQSTQSDLIPFYQDHWWSDSIEALWY